MVNLADVMLALVTGTEDSKLPVKCVCDSGTGTVMKLTKIHNSTTNQTWHATRTSLANRSSEVNELPAVVITVI